MMMEMNEYEDLEMRGQDEAGVNGLACWTDLARYWCVGILFFVAGLMYNDV